MKLKILDLVDPATIRETRRACGFSLADLVDEAGLKGGAPYLSRIERGEIEPGLEILGKITVALRKFCLIEGAGG